MIKVECINEIDVKTYVHPYIYDDKIYVGNIFYVDIESIDELIQGEDVVIQDAPEWTTWRGMHYTDFMKNFKVIS